MRIEKVTATREYKCENCGRPIQKYERHYKKGHIRYCVGCIDGHQKRLE